MWKVLSAIKTGAIARYRPGDRLHVVLYDDAIPGQTAQQELVFRFRRGTHDVPFMTKTVREIRAKLADLNSDIFTRDVTDFITDQVNDL